MLHEALVEISRKLKGDTFRQCSQRSNIPLIAEYTYPVCMHFFLDSLSCRKKELKLSIWCLPIQNLRLCLPINLFVVQALARPLTNVFCTDSATAGWWSNFEGLTRADTSYPWHSFSDKHYSESSMCVLEFIHNGFPSLWSVQKVISLSMKHNLTA